MYFFRQNRSAYARKKLTRERRRSFNGGGKTIRRGVRTEPRPGWKKKTSPIELSFEKEAETKRRRKDRIWIDRRIDVTDPVEIAIEGEERDRDEARRLGAEAADSRSPRPVAWSPRLATASRSRAPIVAALAPPRPPASGSASAWTRPSSGKRQEGDA